jgi:mannose-6-phosphate isomerase-like protein (cupin superfamily)
MSIDADVKAQPFRLRAPLLSQGRQDTVLAESGLMQLRMKVYAEGGENTLHTHTQEDHSFIILQGQARFYDKDGNSEVYGRNQGVLLPRGAYYWFQSCGDEPLVMVRVAARTEEYRSSRTGPDGKPMAGDSAENKQVEPIVIPGAFYE